MNHPDRKKCQAEKDDSPREQMSHERGYERVFQYRESQDKDLVSGSEDEREKGCKNGREKNGWAVYFCFLVF